MTVKEVKIFVVVSNKKMLFVICDLVMILSLSLSLSLSVHQYVY